MKRRRGHDFGSAADAFGARNENFAVVLRPERMKIFTPGAAKRMVQTIQKNIRVTPEQWKRIEKVAEKRDMSPNRLVVELVIKALERRASASSPKIPTIHRTRVWPMTSTFSERFSGSCAGCKRYTGRCPHSPLPSLHRVRIFIAPARMNGNHLQNQTSSNQVNRFQTFLPCLSSKNHPHAPTGSGRTRSNPTARVSLR